MCSQCGHYILRMCGSKTDTKRIVFDAINFAWGTLIRPHSPPHIWFSVVSGKSFKSGFQKRISSRIGPKKFVWIFETTVLTVRPDELPVKVSLANWSSVRTPDSGPDCQVHTRPLPFISDLTLFFHRWTSSNLVSLLWLFLALSRITRWAQQIRTNLCIIKSEMDHQS